MTDGCTNNRMVWISPLTKIMLKILWLCFFCVCGQCIYLILTILPFTISTVDWMILCIRVTTVPGQTGRWGHTVLNLSYRLSVTTLVTYFENETMIPQIGASGLN